MKYLKFLLIGIFFGVLMTKSEAISWYRIYEMFRFESFHMYGIIGAAVVLGATFVFLARKNEWKSADGQPFQFYEYPKTWKRYFFGGTLFGLGWAMTGACPGPLFVLVGNGYLPILVVIVGALMGTIVYGLLADKLPN